MNFKTVAKPPVGIEPKWHHDKIRKENLAAAIMRYLDADLPVPQEWLKEYNDFVKK